MAPYARVRGTGQPGTPLAPARPAADRRRRPRDVHDRRRRVNLGIQDAVADANMPTPTSCAGALLAAQHDGTPVPESLLRAVQRRRQFPTALMQRLQRTMQKRLVEPALRGQTAGVPRMARIMRHVGPVRRWLLRTLATGTRPEHIHTPSPTRYRRARGDLVVDLPQLAARRDRPGGREGRPGDRGAHLRPARPKRRGEVAAVPSQTTCAENTWDWRCGCTSR